MSETASTDRSCSYTGTYLADRDSLIRQLWLALPLLIVIGGVSGIMAMAASTGGGEGGSRQMLMGVLVVIVGAILVTVQISFVDAAQEAYAVAPSFIGLSGATGGVIFPILNLAYLIVMITIAFGMFGGQSVWQRVRGGLRNNSSGGF